MKFEQVYSFISMFLIKYYQFFLLLLNKILNKFTINFFFNWKISNYSDSYWFLYSNKKSIHELRYLKK